MTEGQSKNTLKLHVNVYSKYKFSQLLLSKDEVFARYQALAGLLLSKDEVFARYQALAGLLLSKDEVFARYQAKHH